MSLGIGIFASVALILLVYNKPFRKVMAWVAGVSAGVALLVALAWYIRAIVPTNPTAHSGLYRSSSSE